MSNQNESPLSYLSKSVTFLTVFFGLFAYAIFSYGYVLSELWSWFVVDKFGLPVLSLLEAYGIILVALCAQNVHRDRDAEKHPFKTLFRQLVRPWVLLGTGYVVWSLM